MTITREIDGKTVEIELTADELLVAHFKFQRQSDTEDMEEYLEAYKAEDFEEDFGLKYADAVADIDRLAELLYENMMEYGYSWENARFEAILDWSQEKKEDKGYSPLEYVGGGDWEETAE